MRKRKLFSKVSAFVLALVLAFSMCAAPFEGGIVKASGETTGSQTGSEVSEEDFKVKLLYGDEKLPDEDAVVLTLLGDGFTESALGDPENPEYIPDTDEATADQKKFWNYAYTAARRIMETSPWDEFADCIKIYGIGVVSKDSGVKGCDASTAAAYTQDPRDTYFKTHYWAGGMPRGLVIEEEGEKIVEELLNAKNIKSDCEVVFVNSEVVGGTGGDIIVQSVDRDTYECALHELGHSIGNLQDEYWPGPYWATECANMTQHSDPEDPEFPATWKRFLGANGIGIYEIDEEGWYRPHQACKMQFISKDKEYPYCDVCKEGLRDAISAQTSIQHVEFQTYADKFYQNDDPVDMSEYFIVRKGDVKKTLKEIGSNYTLTYYTADGTELDSQPNEAGNYKVKAAFTGSGSFEAFELTGEYTMNLPNAITITAESRTYDGKPFEVGVAVDYDKIEAAESEVTIKKHFVGKDALAVGSSQDYDSDDAPVKPGDYTVTVSVYKGNELLTDKSQDFTINYAVNKIVDHEDSATYPGAVSWANNKTVVIIGEGFTSEEQDKFLARANELTEYMRNTEPYKEMDLYFNYRAVETVSDESGIGTGASPKKTFLQLTRDASGKLSVSTEQAYAAHNAAYEQADHYYQSVVVIVNDENVKECTTVDPNAATSIKHRSIFITPDETGYAYAAQEVLNRMVADDIGYVPATDEEKAEQRAKLLDSISYGGAADDSGSSSDMYAPILSTAADETFVANGKAIDLSPYFQVYAGRTPIEAGKIPLTITYYENNDGEIGDKISAPKYPGSYYAMAETPGDAKNDWDEVYYSKNIDLSSITGYSDKVNLMKARGLTAFTITAPEWKDPKITMAMNSCAYNGRSQMISVKSVTIGGHPLAEGTEYTVSYSQDTTSVGTVTVTVKGKGSYVGNTASTTYEITKGTPTIKTSHSTYTKTYGNKAFSLGASASNGANLTYRSNKTSVATVNSKGTVTLKSPGAATITISSAASENYKAASKQATILVKPGKATLSSVKSAKKATAAVKWKKVTGATGYQVQYATNKSFKGARTVTVGSGKTTSTTLKKLKAGKKYYVRVRAYTKVKVSDKSKTLTGTYSTPKAVTVKKK